MSEQQTSSVTSARERISAFGRQLSERMHGKPADAAAELASGVKQGGEPAPTVCIKTGETADRSNEQKAPQHTTTDVRAVLLTEVLDSQFQPRKRALSKKDVAELMASIAANGQLTPILVSPDADAPGKFRIHAGHRRCAALRFLGATSVIAVVRKGMTEREARKIAIADNLGREDLSAYEQAMALRDFMAAFSLQFEQAAVELGVSPRTAYRLKAILAASEELLAILRDSAVPAKPAEALVRIEATSKARALRLARQYAEGALTSLDLEAAAKGGQKPKRAPAAGKDVELTADDRLVTLKVRVVRATLSEEQRARVGTAVAQLLGELGISQVTAEARRQVAAG